MSDPLPNKRVVKMPIDRLSSLPDGVRIHILSFLGVKGAVVTSVLSKGWKNLWSRIPTLVFREVSRDVVKKQKFLSMVRETLRIRGSVAIKKFEVCFFFDKSLASDVDSWVEFISKCKLGELRLQLMIDGDDDLYQLPETMYSIPSSTRLSLSGCRMNTARSIQWQSLTHLHLDQTELPQRVIQNVLSCCPVLRTLLLLECWNFDCLKVSSTCLHRLQVHDRQDGQKGPLLEISAPYLQVLDISYHLLGRTLQLKNMASLVKARFEFTYLELPNDETILNTAKEIYEIIQHVKDLYLGCHYFTCISELVANGWKIPISGLSCLTIAPSSEDVFVVTGIIAMLKSSPILEKFVIEDFQEMEELWDQTTNGDLDYKFWHLKTVEFKDFKVNVFNSEPMLTVAEAILKRAPVLEEMVVEIELHKISDYDEICLPLLSYPRSSPKAVIHLSE